MANRTITKQTELMLKELNTPECKLIVQETYQTAIDLYTFRKDNAPRCTLVGRYSTL